LRARSGNNPASMSASTHSMSKLDRKMVPSMSNTAIFRLAAARLERGLRGLGMVAISTGADDSPPSDVDP
jgi:hypothetical protein